MRTDYNTERFQGFLRDLKESFWGDLQGEVRDTLKKLLEARYSSIRCSAALQIVYPQRLHQRCRVHKMRNICEAVRRRDHDQVKRDAQAIYQAPNLAPPGEPSCGSSGTGSGSIPGW